jgi:hypothetical protein
MGGLRAHHVDPPPITAGPIERAEIVETSIERGSSASRVGGLEESGDGDGLLKRDS